MYNGIGLTTPRGTGTNGFVQRNLSAIRKTKEKIVDYTDKEDCAVRPFDVGLIEHEKRRQAEVRCLELREMLEEDGLPEELIEEKVSAFRKKLLEEKKSAVPRDVNGRPILKDSHELSMAQEEKNEKAKSAFGIREDFIPGQSMKDKVVAESAVPALEESKPEDKLSKPEKEKKKSKKRRSSSSSSSSSSTSSSSDDERRKKRRRKEKKKKSKKSHHHKRHHHKKGEEVSSSRHKNRHNSSQNSECDIQVQCSPSPTPSPTQLSTTTSKTPLSNSSRPDSLTPTCRVVNYSSDSSNSCHSSSHGSCIKIVKVDGKLLERSSSPVEIITIPISCNSHNDFCKNERKSRSKTKSKSNSPDKSNYSKLHCYDTASSHSSDEADDAPYCREKPLRAFSKSSSRSSSRSISDASSHHHHQHHYCHHHNFERNNNRNHRPRSYNSNSESPSSSVSPIKRRSISSSSKSSGSSSSRSRSHSDKSRSKSKSVESKGSKSNRCRRRSVSIPRRHGSPSFLDRRRITSARKRPIMYKRRRGSEWEVSDSSNSSHSDSD